DSCLLLDPTDPTSGICPDGFTCLNNLQPQICCRNDLIILPPVPTTTTTTTATTTPIPPTIPPTTTVAPDTCFDEVNPTTGVSDCAKRRNLCTNFNYFSIMSTQCPLTCGFCTSRTRTSCIDQVNPASCCAGRDPCTGEMLTSTAACTSDCANMISYCSMPAFYNLMTLQCPQTCGRCNATISQPAMGTCADLLNPITGYSDCTQRSSLCLDSRYFNIMSIQCPRTCGRCT
ncbi:hypothetical protein PMAYCL1PPCAC_04870, partial [Pristionchus mayeri]